MLCEAGWPVVSRHGPDVDGYTMVALDKRLCSGQVTKWTYQGKHSSPFRAIIFRPVPDSVTIFKIVGINDIPAGNVNTPVVYRVPKADRITVKEGDMIGWSFGTGVLTYNRGGGSTIRYVGGNQHADLVANNTIDIDLGPKSREYSIKATVYSFGAGTKFSL